VLGDVSGDGRVTADDVSALIEAIYEGVDPPEADTNNDHTLTAADIVALLPLIE